MFQPLGPKQFLDSNWSSTAKPERMEADAAVKVCESKGPFGLSVLAIKSRTDLRDFSQCHDVSVLFKSEMLKRKWLAKSRKCLHFIEDHQKRCARGKSGKGFQRTPWYQDNNHLRQLRAQATNTRTRQVVEPNVSSKLKSRPLSFPRDRRDET